MHASLSIRPARREDCPEIRRLIQELADYEKMPDGPKIDAKQLEEDGFGAESFFQCLVTEDVDQPDKLVGYCIYFYVYSTWEGRSVYMEDLYVTRSHRKKGLGLGMWRRLVSTALEKKCTRCNFAVLNWNEPSMEFYKSFGALDLTVDEKWHSFRMNRPEMEKFVQND